MALPKIILNVFSSVDGKLTTAPGRNVSEWTVARMDGDAHDVTHRLYDYLGCDGLLSGSETLMVYGNDWVSLDPPIYEPKKSKAYIVVDGRGRMDWQQTEGLIVLTREDVSSSYIKQLQEKNITYIQAGTGDHVDLSQALLELYEMGFRRLGLSGGGGINGAFLRNHLIDEISLVLAPLAIGGKGTPSIFDAEELNDLSEAGVLDLKKTEPVGNGAVWLHYHVKK